MTLFHILSKWLPELVSPLGVALACLLVALLLHRRTRLRTGFLAAGIVCLWAFGMPATSRALIASLESRYPAAALESLERADLTILLGGGLNRPDGLRPRAELGPSGDRIALVADLWHAGLTERIFVSGGTLAPVPGTRSEAAHTRTLLERWGVPAGAISIEGESGTTFENAAFSARTLGDDASVHGRVFLVTSAMHLPRARALFCHAGIDTIGMPANRWVTAAPPWYELGWLPDATALRGSSQALREWLGIAVYGLLGRLDTGALAHDRDCASHQA